MPGCVLVVCVAVHSCMIATIQETIKLHSAIRVKLTLIICPLLALIFSDDDLFCWLFFSVLPVSAVNDLSVLTSPNTTWN